MGLHLIVADVTWTPASFAELKTLVAQLSFATRHLLRFDFAQVGWTILTTRNKFTIKHTFPNSPADCLHKSSSFLQKWKLLSKEGDREEMELLIARV